MTKYPPRCVCVTPETIFVNQNGDRFVREDGRRGNICSLFSNSRDRSIILSNQLMVPIIQILPSPDWRSGDGFTREYLEENGLYPVADTLEGTGGKD